MMPSARGLAPGTPLARPALSRHRGVVGFLCVVLIAFFSPWATYLSFYPFVTPVTICVYAGLAAVSLHFVSPLSRKSISPPEFYLLLYLCIVLLSFAWSMSMESWYNYAFWWSIGVATFVIASQFCNSVQRLTWVMYGAVLGSIVAMASMGVAVDELGRDADRYSVDTLNSNFSAYILSGSVFMIAALSRITPFTLKARLFFAAYTVAAVYAEILLGTRGAVISTCAVALWMLIGTRFSRYVTILIFTATMSVALILTSGLLDHLLLTLDSISSRSTGDLTGRLQIWPDAIEFISQHPALGIGPGSFIDVGYNHVGAHNIILTILLDTGIVGLSVMVLFFAAVFSAVLKHMDRQIGPFIVMLFAMYFVPIATSGHWEGAPFSWMLVAFTYNLALAPKPAPAPGALRRALLTRSPAGARHRPGVVR